MAGHAIIDCASFSIIGDPKRPYDTYPEQLVADAQAAVDQAVRLAVADPEPVGVTGHSHGALMAVDLIAHSQRFRAAVATSGSYNKTLTPFGFQNERRSVWEAPEVYTTVSPFYYADKIKTPLLIEYGPDDANPGTTPLQATKRFEAVRSDGGTARLVMRPFEPHWYTALESNEQLAYEMVNWFDRHIKNAPQRAAQPAVAVKQDTPSPQHLAARVGSRHPRHGSRDSDAACEDPRHRGMVKPNRPDSGGRVAPASGGRTERSGARKLAAMGES